MTESRVEQTDEPISALWLLAILVRDRRILGAFATVGLVLAVTVALLRSRTYTTSFSFVPQTNQEPNAAGLASLAGQFGINLGSLGGVSQSPQFYGDLVLMRGVLGPIVRDSFAVGADTTLREPLPTFLGVRDRDARIVVENTLQKLRTDVISASVAARTTGMVTVRVRTRSPWVSLGIAERLLTGLNDFNTVTRQSQAREERRFTEGRLAAAKGELHAAEDALQRFLLTNRGDLSDAPVLSMQRGRLEREVQLQQQVVTSLAQQYEQNRIREVRDTPVITVIEAPVLAARPDSGLRVLIVMIGTLAGLLLGAILVVVRDTWTRESGIGPDPAQALLVSEWKRLRGVADS